MSNGLSARAKVCRRDTMVQDRGARAGKTNTIIINDLGMKDNVRPLDTEDETHVSKRL